MIMAVRMKDERAAERRCRMKFMFVERGKSKMPRSGKIPLLFQLLFMNILVK